jgi:hypothetical protein
MNKIFRKYHRRLATLFCLPLFFTALTGMSISIAEEGFHHERLAAFLLSIHTFEIIKLEAILPILNGLGLMGLVATGLSMTSLFAKPRQPKQMGERS